MILLTVFVDLITAVAIGLFVANVITITRLSKLQEADVKAVCDPDKTDLELSAQEHELLKKARDNVLLLYLRGSMIFGVSRAISRKNSEVEACKALVIDFTDVNHLGVSASLALEEAILDMVKARRAVYIVGAKDQVNERLQTLGIHKLLPQEHFVKDRTEALKRAVNL